MTIQSCAALLFLSFLVPACSAGTQPDFPGEFDLAGSIELIEELSSEKYDERIAGSRGGIAACALLASKLSSCGLEVSFQNYQDNIPRLTGKPKFAVRP